MSALVLQLADAVVADLEVAATSGEFAPPFMPVRRVRPRRKLDELTDLAVTVVPKSVEVSSATRGSRAVELKVDVAVQQRLAPEAEDSDAELDGLFALVQALVDHFAGRRLGTFVEAIPIGVANDPIYAVEHLDELRVFTSVITLTYRVHR